jgi:hypothetical protein
MQKPPKKETSAYHEEAGNGRPNREFTGGGHEAQTTESLGLSHEVEAGLMKIIAPSLIIAALTVGLFRIDAVQAATIDRFVSVSDCIFPDPRRGILSYRVSGGVFRVRIAAVHHGGRTRVFYSQWSGRTPSPGMAATGVQDPGATGDVEAYILTALGEFGSETTRRLDFRYRRAVFDLSPPTFHTLSGRLALYQSFATVSNIDSVSCLFRMRLPFGGELAKRGSAGIFRGGRVARCDVIWNTLQQARAGAPSNGQPASRMHAPREA